MERLVPTAKPQRTAVQVQPTGPMRRKRWDTFSMCCKWFYFFLPPLHSFYPLYLHSSSFRSSRFLLLRLSKLYCKKLFLFVLVTFSRTAEISEAIFLIKYGFVLLFLTQFSCSTCISFRLSSFLFTRLPLFVLLSRHDKTPLVSFLVRGSGPYFAKISNPDPLLYLLRNGSSRRLKIA